MFHYVVINPMVAGTLVGNVFYPALSQDASSYIAACTREVIEAGLVYAVAFVLSKFLSSLMLGWAWRQGDAGQHAA
jgi:hypothetical protein